MSFLWRKTRKIKFDFLSLKKVNSDYGELEKTCEKLPSMGIVPNVPALGNSGQLSLDSSIEKVQLNQQIQRGHVWWEHLQGNQNFKLL